MSTLHPATLAALRRDALLTEARRRAARGRQAAMRLAWARFARLIGRLSPQAGPRAPTPPLQQKAC